MWKGCRSAEAVKCGVWAAVLAQQGMTGPPQPFEGRGGVWYSQGRVGKEFPLPAGLKWLSIAGSTSVFLRINRRRRPSRSCRRYVHGPSTTRSLRSSTTCRLQWEEIGDAPKWDPRNRDTADHSLPYVLARGIISGEIYLDYFSLDKIPFRDPAMKELIDKITLSPVAEWRGHGRLAS